MKHTASHERTLHLYAIIFLHADALMHFDAFVTELKKRSSQCEFATLQDSLIRDMIVIGVMGNSLRERLLRLDNLSLEDAIKLGQAAEATKKHAYELCRSQENQTIEALKLNQNNIKSRITRQENNEYISQPCKYCGTLHRHRKCPAFGKTCLKCNKLNHFVSVCLSSKKRIDLTQAKLQQESGKEDFFIGVVEQSKQSKATPEENTMSLKVDERDWFICLQSNGSKIRYKMDTGAQANVLPLSTYNQLNIKPILEETNVKLSAYNGGDIPTIGKCELNLVNKNESHKVMFIVTDTKSPPLLGLQTCQKLNIIKRIWAVNTSDPNLMAEYKDVFGCLQGEYRIITDPEVKPVTHPPRKIPISMMYKLKAELERMKQLNVIDKIDEPSDWASSLVIVEKPNGQIRLCLDPRDLNKAIKRHHHPMPTVDEILAKLGGAKMFSKLDASSGYWQIKVDDESSKLLTSTRSLADTDLKDYHSGYTVQRKCSKRRFLKSLAT